MQISAPFVPTKWDEVDYGPLHAGTKTTKASIEYKFSGDIAGTASVEYLMFYSSFDPTDMHASEASFVGLVQVTGSIAGRVGTVTLQDVGTFSRGIANSTLTILEGSGIGQLEGISGSGISKADGAGAHWLMEIEL